MNRIEIPGQWWELVPEIQRTRGAVMVMGATDTGKTTLTRYLVKKLVELGETVAYIDGDIGQSVLGPPTTQGLSVLGGRAADFGHASVSGAYFVGSTSPRGHGRETLVGLKKLLEKAKSDKSTVAVVDTTGYVTGEDAQELKYQKIDLLGPSHIVAVQRDREIEPILKPQECRERVAIHRIRSCSAVRRRSPEERRRYRFGRFQAYFQHVRLHTVDLKQTRLTGTHRLKLSHRPQEVMDGLLVGFNDRDNFLVALGIVERFDRARGVLACLVPAAPDLDRARTLRLGSIRVDLSEETGGEQFLVDD